MPTRPVTVLLGTIGASAGPFNISDNVLGVIAMGVTRAQLLAGYVVNSDVNASSIVVKSVGPCTNSITITLPTPTPTPTPTPGPPATPTPTPTPTPVIQSVFFDTNYTSTSDICGEGGRAWTRLTGPSGSIVNLTVDIYHPVMGLISSTGCIRGSLYETTLPSINPVTGSLLTTAYDSIDVAFVPAILTNNNTVSVTIPASGYKDIILVYRTTNLLNNFTNGYATAYISAFNGSPVSNGPFITAIYGCSDSGTCI